MLNSESQMKKKFQSFLTENDIKSIKFDNQSINTEIGSEGYSDWMVFSSQVIQDIFKVLLNKKNYNLLIIDKTNVVIGLLRKVCKWNYSSLISEYRLYSGKNSNYFAETFLELATIQLKPQEFIQLEQNHNRYIGESLDHTISSSLLERRFSEDEPMDDNEEENLLSGSPQVPKALLKMVEMRKKNNKQAENSKHIFDLYSLSKPDEMLFYKPEEINFNSVETIKIELPAENELPEWFKSQRNMWIQEFNAIQ